jgi:predicted nucleic acid-binding protein
VTQPVLALAQERAPATAILDDATARSCAKAIGVPVIGTLGLVLRAKKQGLVKSAAEIMKAIVNAGLYVDDETIRMALEHIGETWETSDD